VSNYYLLPPGLHWNGAFLWLFPTVVLSSYTLEYVILSWTRHHKAELVNHSISDFVWRLPNVVLSSYALGYVILSWVRHQKAKLVNLVDRSTSDGERYKMERSDSVVLTVMFFLIISFAQTNTGVFFWRFSVRDWYNITTPISWLFLLIMFLSRIRSRL
jgi:hypothetical protein